MAGSDNPSPVGPDARPAAVTPPPEGSLVPAGVIVLAKPRGPTSMQAVSRIRGRVRAGIAALHGPKAGPRRPKVGHAGTLDPLAEGVLLVGVGAATRSLGDLMGLEKHYRTRVDLSAVSTTDDDEGELTAVDVPVPPTREQIESAVAAFAGRTAQRPPIHSAVKIDGKRAYAAARRGATPELAARPVVVHAIRVDAYVWPQVTVSIRCGKGFYVRSFARMLGERLGTGGTCRTIERRGIGPFTMDEAVDWDDLPDPITEEHLVPLPTARDRVRAWHEAQLADGTWPAAPAE